ncbi:MAG: 50S ribosomal subunit-associated GTPase HflX [Patiriisocius sp.]|jgi:50S ribosomal subunit-associated GTPase HflX
MFLDLKTHENLETELRYLEEYHKKIPVIVIGNKSDKFNEMVSEPYFSSKPFENCLFTTAKTGENVATLFEGLSKKLLC